MGNPYACMYVYIIHHIVCLTFDCLQQVSLSRSAQRAMEIRDWWIKKREMSPLENLPLQGRIPYWGPRALSSSQPILCAHICVCVCVWVSGGKSMALVLLSVSSVSLVSYHQPPSPPPRCRCFCTCQSAPGDGLWTPQLCIWGNQDTASTVQRSGAIREFQICGLKPKKSCDWSTTRSYSFIKTPRRWSWPRFSDFKNLAVSKSKSGTPTPDLMPNSFYYDLSKKNGPKSQGSGGKCWLGGGSCPYCGTCAPAIFRFGFHRSQWFIILVFSTYLKRKSARVCQLH